MKISLNTLKKCILLLLGVVVTTIALMSFVYSYMYLQLPDVDSLKNAKLQVPLRIFTADGKLLAQFGEERRTPVTLNDVPKPLIQAILATEDQRYFEHSGVDMIGLGRAVVAVVTSGKKSQGASTITMQVARNFFLSRKKTFGRKLNEILLAIKIESQFSKDKILELYLNKIYLGHRAYGVAAAAEVYFGKTLDKLSLDQLAMIAGLPQAPSRDNPINNPEAAKGRRNHVLARMLENGYITREQYKTAVAVPVDASYHLGPIEIYAPYIAEMVRTAMVDVYDKDAYTDGFNVYTTIDSKLQIAANQSLVAGLEKYDARHGFRGALENWGKPRKQDFDDWQELLSEMPIIYNLQPAAVIEVAEKTATVLIADGTKITIPWEGLSWARRNIDDQYLGAYPKTASEVVKPGDIVEIKKTPSGQWTLSQIPEVEGALVALDPKNGSVLALAGGYCYEKSHFNRATQAKRQPGSAFKPFVYSAALSKGYTLASMVNDSPLVFESAGVDQFWRPHNSNDKFNGPTSLRSALVNSRNLVSIRVLRDIGIDDAINYVHRFGFNDEALPRSLTMALGSGSVTPLQLTAGYSVFANGGYRVKPYFINTIAHTNGEVVYQEHPLMICEDCESDEAESTSKDHGDILPAPRVITPQNAYLITSVLQEVIQEGTGKYANTLNRKDIAGKTGTTNNQFDAWFAGYNQDIVATVWIGFDQPKSLFEYGAQAAVPIWTDFMRVALKDKPLRAMAQPADIVNVRIDPATGLMAQPDQTNARFEIFQQNSAPSKRATKGSQAKATMEMNNDVSELF